MNARKQKINKKLSWDVVTKMLLYELSGEKERILKKITDPIIKIISRQKNTIMDLGVGVGTIEMQILKKITPKDNLQLIINDREKSMLEAALWRIKNEARASGLERVSVKGICGDLAKVTLSCRRQADAVIFSRALHELVSAGGIQKARRGLKSIYNLLSEGGTLSLCDFADLSPEKSINFISIKFKTVKHQAQFREQCTERYKYSLKHRMSFPADYRLYQEKQLIPASIVIDTLYGIFAGVPAGHLQAALFTEKDILTLLENSGFKIMETAKFKCAKDMVHFARRIGIVNAEEIVELLPPEYIVILSKKPSR